MRFRHETDSTAEEYASREEWRKATPSPCLRGRPCEACPMVRHGTYGRKMPVWFKVARWRCRPCGSRS